VAVIDWYSRRVLSRRISNSMVAVLGLNCPEDALRVHGKPETQARSTRESTVCQSQKKACRTQVGQQAKSYRQWMSAHRA